MEACLSFWERECMLQTKAGKTQGSCDCRHEWHEPWTWGYAWLEKMHSRCASSASTLALATSTCACMKTKQHGTGKTQSLGPQTESICSHRFGASS
eukprot:1145401-Pelagomonas_calceolata.AAC.18